jgi:hypothetical protein
MNSRVSTLEIISQLAHDVEQLTDVVAVLQARIVALEQQQQQQQQPAVTPYRTPPRPTVAESTYPKYQRSPRFPRPSSAVHPPQF